ncbi:hypothetical protein GC093_16455 [Paenibacillus sp. LMG 31456]|uniref:Oligogalacturonate lyase domain-containing protein n=1 Tax=Paenibacillus foliorum TaxID=2654974 RepID=A0A972GUM7_9BACL|nr:oligogalacturonate lyase family protein [Paenibacillus foliorum]NOU94799.1 hypothetical protein [Paenibacillus foliorum]
MKGNTVQHIFQDRVDESTGRKVRQLTSTQGNHHHLYFTSSSFTLDNNWVLYISAEYEGSPNIYKLSLENGEAVQLTDNRDGILKSYVYYEGNPYRGLGKASPSYNPHTKQLLYIQGNEVRLLQIDSLEEKVIYELPPNNMTGFTHLSMDGKYACVPYISSDAFEVGEGNPFTLIRDKVQAEQLESKMLVIDTETGVGEILFSQVGWITHVQFHPTDHRQILYNHEGGMVEQRIWLYDNGHIHKVRDQSAASSDLWICHEMWLRDGDGILYHGSKGLPNDPSMQLGRQRQGHTVSFIGCKLHTGEPVELEFPANMVDYGHFTSGNNDHLLVTDGIIDSYSIHICNADWSKRELSWERLCQHNSSFLVQDVHPHPIFSHDERFILFTSDQHNSPTQGHIYLIEVSE